LILLAFSVSHGVTAGVAGVTPADHAAVLLVLTAASVAALLALAGAATA
jgi:hypothetical protein